MDRTRDRQTQDPPREIQFALARQFHQDTAAGALGHPLAAAVAAFIVWGSVPDWLALGFVALVATASLARIHLHRRARSIGELGALVRQTRLSTLGVAAAWGVGLLALVPQTPSDAEGRILILVAGIVAIGTVTHVADRRTFHLFTAFLLGSALLGTLFAGLDRLLGADVLMILIFWGMMVVIHGRMHDQLRTVLETGQRLRETSQSATRQREFLDAVLDGSPDGVLLVDPLGRIDRVSHEAAHILGSDGSELTGLDLEDQTDRGPVWAGLVEAAAAVRDGTTPDREITVSDAADGHPASYLVSGAAGRDVATGWTLLQVQDVTGIRQAEAALDIAQAEYRQVVEAARDLIWAVDEQGHWTFLNAAARDLYGEELDELLGRNALEWAVDERKQADREAFQHLLRGGELVNYETVHRVAGGESRTLSFSARPLRDPQGRIVGAQGIARDVTAEVEAREEAHRMAERTSLLRSLINASEDLIFYKGPDGRYRGSNDAFAQFYGLTEDELIGLTDHDIVDAERAVAARKTDRQALETGSPIVFESWRPAPDGEMRLRETVKTVVKDESGEPLGILGIARDVTERKRNEERMRQMAEEAERATRMKSAFLANMSHEIRTPMNGVLGMAELLQFTSLDDEQRQYVGVIQSSADNLLGILNDILDLSKIEAERLELETIPYDLHRVLSDAVRVLAIPAARRGNELLLDVDARLPRWVAGDPGRLRQVITNLTGNAVKFTESGEVLVTARRLDRDDLPWVRIGVQDTGIGIPEEKQEVVFRHFEQADTSVTRQYGGTGLGLAICRHLVELMGGSIGVESTPGEGSLFWFELPLEIAEAQPADPHERPVPRDLSGVGVLVVDDHETNRDILRRMLEGVGAEVREVVDGPSALALVEDAEAREGLDLILLDEHMPGMDGLETAERLLEGPGSDVPILILTSASQVEDARRARELGVKGYHLKPIPRDDLLRAVAAATGLEPEETTTAEVDPTEGTGRGGTLLLAEDNEVNRMVAQAILEKAGYTVEIATHGREALERVLRGGIDVVLMDVQMPEMDGIEATRRIRTAESGSTLHVPIVALTAHAYGEEEARCRAAGMDGFLSKPFHARDLLSTVATWMREAPERREKVAATESTEASAEAPPVDVDAFRASLREAGIEEVAEPTLGLFLKDLVARRDAMVDARKRGDITGIAQAAHALKSGAGNVRADDAQEILSTLEERARDGDAGVLGPTFDEALDELARVEGYLREEGFGG